MPSEQYDNRYKKLNDAESSDGKYLVYWMQASQRVEQNHALEFAVEWANKEQIPLVVFFGITDDYPDANERHYAFMLQGLKETKHQLADRNIRLVVWHESPEKGIVRFAQDACGVVTDRGYTKIQRAWRTEVSENLECPFYQVETNVVVPVEVVSEKREYAARTIRPKIHQHLDTFLSPVEQVSIDNPSLSLGFDGLDISEPDAILKQLHIDRS
ncbi:MAG: deoxyribodipyrimidine photolyase, partial [Candidatus Marinimicrobia bacterium]|nr:deoxyribodipyrimidine photolyase [Candidatus Neomarinimicrobiota bacterium]